MLELGNVHVFRFFLVLLLKPLDIMCNHIKDWPNFMSLRQFKRKIDIETYHATVVLIGFPGCFPSLMIRSAPWMPPSLKRTRKSHGNTKEKSNFIQNAKFEKHPAKQISKCYRNRKCMETHLFDRMLNEYGWMCAAGWG